MRRWLSCASAWEVVVADQCDCLNECGDDERVGRYEVEPCPGALNYSKRRLAELQAEVDLREDTARWRWFRAAFMPNGLGLYGAELDAAVDDEIRAEREVANG